MVSANFKGIKPSTAENKKAQPESDNKIDDDNEIKRQIEQNEKPDWFSDDQGILHPDWKFISKWVWDAAETCSIEKLWYHIALNWFEKLCKSLGQNFFVFQSSNFFVFSSQKDSYVEDLSSFLEASLAKIQKVLRGIAREKWSGRFVVLVLNDLDQYYRYISHYHKEGTYGTSSGCYINAGYGHFIFPFQEIRLAESIVSHELTHACLYHLHPPTWLNEALAISLEKIATGTKPIDGDLATRGDHLQYWNRIKEFWQENSLNAFWTGESFKMAGEVQRYSYSFADALFNLICDRYGEHKEFILHSSIYDAGNSAAQCFYGENLDDIVSSMIGEGNWTPSTDLILKHFKGL